MNILNVEEKNENLNSILYSCNEEELLIKFENSPYILPMRIRDFNDEKECFKFLKVVERIIRISSEYKLWREYIKENLGEKYCKITGEKDEETSVELHHHPFSLFSLCKFVTKDYMLNGKTFCSFDVACDVIELHYKMKASFIPLVSSLHEKFHNGFLELPMEFVIGDWKWILNKYGHLMDEEDKEIVRKRIGVNKENCGWNITWVKPQ